MPKKLLVAAVAEELAAFPAPLPGYDRLVTGPGKLNAAVLLSEALERAEYEEVLVVGTSGLVDADTEDDLEGRVFEVSAAVQHDVTDLDGVRGRHISLRERIELGHPGVVVATGDSFVDDAEEAAFIRSLGARLVDMETYAYAWVSQRRGVPIRVVRAVSDRAQDGATARWDEVVTTCSRWLWEYVAREGIVADAADAPSSGADDGHPR